MNDPQIRSLFGEALGRPSAQERAAYLDEACRGDVELRTRLEALLAAHDEAGGFLQGSPEPLTDTVAAPPTEGPGTLIGPYKLLEQIGEGGMGIVFMAEQQRPVRRRVALKIIKPGMDTRQVVARFEAERQALALMDHPNIARVLDAGATESGRPYFVMELVRGIPITDYCDKAKVPIRQRLELFMTVCRAVQHAHQKGIIHRDLKPSNVLVTLHDGVPVPKVIDFGVAKATSQPLTEHSLYTGFAQLIGTPAYMSPEQAELSGLDVDTRSDVYSLGVLLYELLTGSTPFDKEILHKSGLDEFRRMVREVDPPLPSSRISTLHGGAISTVAMCRASEPRKLGVIVRGELDWLVMKALEKDRNRRYETASAFAADVDRYLTNQPVQACPPSAAYRLRKFLRRNKGAVLAATLVVLTLIGGATGTTIGMVRALDAEQLATTRLTATEEALKRAEEQTAIAEAVTEFVRNDLFGQPDIASLTENYIYSVVRDPDVKVHTLLDRAAKTIEHKFRDQPLTEAAIRLTLADAYRELGQDAEAEENAERAVKLRTAELGFDHPDTMTSRRKLGIIYRDAGWLRNAGEHKKNQGNAILQEVLETRTAKLGPDHPQTLLSKTDRAAQYQGEGKVDLAASLFEEALEKQTATLGRDHPDSLQSIWSLALCYRFQHKATRAEPLFKEAIDICVATLGPDAPTTLSLKKDLGQLYRAYSETNHALHVFLELVPACVAKLGPDHPLTLECKRELASLTPDHDMAASLLGDVLAAHIGRSGPDHQNTLITKDQLAEVYVKQGKYALAESLFKEVIDARTSKLGPDDPQTLVAKVKLANLWNNEDVGRYAMAASLLKEVLEKQAATLGPHHPDTVTSKVGLAKTYRLLHKYDLAETILNQEIDAWADTSHAGFMSVNDKIGNNIMSALERLYSIHNKPEQLESQYKTLLEKVAAKWGHHDAHAFRIKAALAELYSRQGRYEEAESVYDELIQTQNTKLGPDHWDTLWNQNRLGHIYMAHGRYDKAEALFRERIELTERKLGPLHQESALAQNSLGWVLVRQNKFAEAETPFRQCLAANEEMQPDTVVMFNAKSELGGCLVGQEKYAEAEPLLLDSYHGMLKCEAKFPGWARPVLAPALERLVELYVAWGKPEEAAKWRKDLESRRAAQKEAAKQQAAKEQEAKQQKAKEQEAKTRDEKKEAKQPEAKNEAPR